MIWTLFPVLGLHIHKIQGAWPLDLVRVNWDYSSDNQDPQLGQWDAQIQ